MKEEDLHYLAGIIDGEGSIYISANLSYKRKNVRIRPRFRLEMKLDQNEHIFSLLEETANKLCIPFNGKEKEGGTKYFDIGGNENIVEFLSFLSPYLRSKRKQAEIVTQAPWMTEEDGGLSNVERRERLLELLESREEIRKLNAERPVKYDKQEITEMIRSGNA